MTTPLLSSRAQAAQSLGVAADASAESARAAFLRRVAADDFAPPEGCVSAANTLANVALPLSPEAIAEAGANQRALVEAFAAAYWSMEPAQRRSRWDELLGETTDHYARFRLEKLENGLALAVKTHDNPLVQEIADAISALYVLGPRDRAIQRTIWLAEHREQIDDLRDAARRFRPDAELGVELLSALFKGKALVPVPVVDRAVVEAERSERAVKAAARVQEKMIESNASAGSGSGAKNGEFSNYTLLYIGVGIIAGIIRFASSNSTNIPAYNPPPQNLSPPYPSSSPWRDLRSPQDGELKPSAFTTVEVQSFTAYEFDQSQRELRELFPELASRKEEPKSSPIKKPPRYDEWILEGRPGAWNSTIPRGN
ncbi:MAG TPA: hypothetical protein VGL71_11395 [Urbifossiella sp.]|jgi:hypothetical protein